MVQAALAHDGRRRGRHRRDRGDRRGRHDRQPGQGVRARLRQPGRRRRHRWRSGRSRPDDLVRRVRSRTERLGQRSRPRSTARGSPSRRRPGADPRVGPRPCLERGLLTRRDPRVLPDCTHDRSAPADCRPLVPPRGLAHRLRGPRPQGRGRRALAARRQLRDRARGLVGTSRGPRAHGRDAVLLDRGVRASRRGGAAGRRWAAVRPARDGHAADWRPRARPVPAAARAVRPDRRRHRAAGSGGRPTRSPATARRSASIRGWAR